MKVLIGGDFSPRARGKNLVDSEEYENYFKGIRELTGMADFSIINFETNISTSKSKPIEKNGPVLTTTENSLKLIKYLGFNVVTLANNHFYDYGDDAVENTLKCLNETDIRYVGGGINIDEAKKTLFLTSSGETLAVINACEHEFSIASEEHGGSYGVDPIQIFYDIQEAKKNADYILVIIHGGHEYHQLPSIRMQEWYRFFIDAGADAVINHHQHCFSGREIYKNKPIYYGLGNFFFDKKNQKERTTWNEGLLVELNFTPQRVEDWAIPFIQCLDEASVILRKNDKKLKIKFKELSENIADEKKLKKLNHEYCMKSKHGLLSYFQPYGNRILKYLYRQGLLPSLITKRKIMAIRNIIECEAHSDRLKEILRYVK